VPAKGCVLGERTAGTPISPGEVVSTPGMVPVCAKAPTGPYLDAARSDRFGYAPPAPCWLAERARMYRLQAFSR